MDTLHEYLPKNILPKDYGDCLETIQEIKGKFLKKIYHNREHFLDDSKWKIDETKRKIS